jgi:hypothetical protein
MRVATRTIAIITIAEKKSITSFSIIKLQAKPIMIVIVALIIQMTHTTPVFTITARLKSSQQLRPFMELKKKKLLIHALILAITTGIIITTIMMGVFITTVRLKVLMRN